MEFWKKYRHVGYSHPSVCKHWQPIVEKAIIDIEKIMWPQWWLPFWAKKTIHFLATDNSVVRVKFWWAHRLRTKLTGGRMITQIKDKFAGLRMYVHGCAKMNAIVEQAVKDCDEICEACGSKDDVQVTDTHWMYNYCAECRNKMNEK